MTTFVRVEVPQHLQLPQRKHNNSGTTRGALVPWQLGSGQESDLDMTQAPTFFLGLPVFHLRRTASGRGRGRRGGLLTVKRLNCSLTVGLGRPDPEEKRVSTKFQKGFVLIGFSLSRFTVGGRSLSQDQVQEQGRCALACVCVCLCFGEGVRQRGGGRQRRVRSGPGLGTV